MRLPAQYDAVIRMPPKTFALIIETLDQQMTRNVRISMRENQGVKFIKEKADPNLNRGGDSPLDMNANEYPPGVGEVTISDFMDLEKIIVLVKNRIRESGMEKAFCMMCLHKYINKISREYPHATNVTMYMGTKVPTLLRYTVLGLLPRGHRDYTLPVANHIYHQESDRDAVRRNILLTNDKNWESSEDGSDEVNSVDGDWESSEDGDEVNAEDGE